MKACVLGEFGAGGAARAAARRCGRAGTASLDIHSPYPLHGADEALGLKRSTVPLVALIAGVDRRDHGLPAPVVHGRASTGRSTSATARRTARPRSSRSPSSSASCSPRSRSSSGSSSATSASRERITRCSRSRRSAPPPSTRCGSPSRWTGRTPTRRPGAAAARRASESRSCRRRVDMKPSRLAAPLLAPPRRLPAARSDVAQPKVKAYQASEHYADDLGMRAPPAGTVPHRPPLEPAVADGPRPDGRRPRRCRRSPSRPSSSRAAASGST